MTQPKGAHRPPKGGWRSDFWLHFGALLLPLLVWIFSFSSLWRCWNLLPNLNLCYSHQIYFSAHLLLCNWCACHYPVTLVFSHLKMQKNPNKSCFWDLPPAWFLIHSLAKPNSDDQVHMHTPKTFIHTCSDGWCHVQQSQQHCSRREGGEERETGSVCWDNWIEAIRRRAIQRSDGGWWWENRHRERRSGETRRPREQAEVSEETGNTRDIWLQPLPW